MTNRKVSEGPPSISSVGEVWLDGGCLTDVNDTSGILRECQRTMRYGAHPTINTRSGLWLDRCCGLHGSRT